MHIIYLPHILVFYQTSPTCFGALYTIFRENFVCDTHENVRNGRLHNNRSDLFVLSVRVPVVTQWTQTAAANGLSPRRRGFGPRAVNVWFVSGKVTLWQVFLRVLRSYPVSFHQCPTPIPSSNTGAKHQSLHIRAISFKVFVYKIYKN
jgi:hypothetical protein